MRSREFGVREKKTAPRDESSKYENDSFCYAWRATHGDRRVARVGKPLFCEAWRLACVTCGWKLQVETPYVDSFQPRKQAERDNQKEDRRRCRRKLGSHPPQYDTDHLSDESESESDT